MQLWFVSVNRVSDNDFVRYGLHELLSLGVKVNVVDVSDLMWNLQEDKLCNYISFDVEYCRYLPEFKKIVLSMGNDDVVLCGGVLSPKLHNILSTRCKFVGLQTLGAIPRQEAVSSRLTNIVKKLRNKKIVTILVNKIYSYFVFKKHPFYFVQRAGYMSSGSYSGVTSQTEIVESQCYDIYQTLYQKKITSIVDERQNYFLWIDQAIPYHTDTLKCNGDISEFAVEYFNRIQSLLARCKLEHNCQVIVSLHPRMINDPRYIDIWSGWETITSNTNGYIEKAKFCLSHNSTAIHAVAYYNKPLIIVKDILLTEQGYDNGITDSFANELGCNIIESDELESVQNFNLHINSEKYAKYINRYVSNISSSNAENANAIYNLLIKIKAKVDK
tara:strand:- start:5099 stop:6259 length:1161 start_codon:yes stop_codon:yes gene_type:complete